MNTDSRRLTAQLRQHVLPVRANLRKRVVTARVLLAFLEQQVDRPRRRLRMIKRHLQISRRHAHERRCAHMFRMLTHVNEHRAGSVRQAEQVDPFVAQPASHIIEIIHRDRRRVFREISALSNVRRKFFT